MKDAWALGGEEGRDKLRKAAPRGKYPQQARMSEWGNPPCRRAWHHAKSVRRTRGTETSHYPEEKKTKVIAQVVASERAGAQTGRVEARPGLKDRQ